MRGISHWSECLAASHRHSVERVHSLLVFTMSSSIVLAIIKKILIHGQYFCVYPSAFLDGPRCPYSPEDYRMPFETVELKTSDGIALRCYLLNADKAERVRATIVMFLGNGMEIGGFEELRIAKKFFKMRCNVLMVSYRGYGLSEGSPTEKGLRRDAQAALDYVLSNPRLMASPVVVYGLSLGGAVAIDLTSRNPTKISALIVENTFTSLPDVVHGWPVVGFISFLCHQRWNSAAKIVRIPPTLPILMLSGRKDEVVPPKHMSKLHQLALTRGRRPRKSKEEQSAVAEDTSEYTVFEAFPHGTHVFTSERSGYKTTIRRFLDRKDIQRYSKQRHSSESSASVSSKAVDL
ncbi:hypothetical protein APHAL10511_005371 [Amanita phalloides]|nr:hypothetical protein APHAL10511_005371 [Amanita phalloides]